MKLLTLMDLLVVDATLFDGIQVDSRLDKALLQQTIIARLGAREPVYTNTTLFKYQMENWFNVHAQNITKLIDTTLLDYNPIDNYDRYETGSRNTSGENSREESVTRAFNRVGMSNTTNSGNDTVTLEGGGGDSTTRSAFDAEDFVPYQSSSTNTHGTNTTTYGGKNDVTTSTEDKGTDTTNSSGKDSGTESYNNHMHGNIGVTTTQQMIVQERQVVLFNVYDWIIDELDNLLFLGMWN